MKLTIGLLIIFVLLFNGITQNSYKHKVLIFVEQLPITSFYRGFTSFNKSSHYAVLVTTSEMTQNIQDIQDAHKRHTLWPEGQELGKLIAVYYYKALLRQNSRL